MNSIFFKLRLLLPGLVAGLCLTHADLLHAQSAPPDNAAFWFESSSFSLTEPTELGSWPSSTGDDVFLAAGTTPPLFNPEGFNNHGLVEFDGTGWFEFDGASDLMNGNKTIIAFFRPRSTNYSLFAKGRAVSSNAQVSDICSFPFGGNFRMAWNEGTNSSEMILFPHLPLDSLYFLRIEINRQTETVTVFFNEEEKGTAACAPEFAQGLTERPLLLGSFPAGAQFTMIGDILDFAVLEDNTSPEQLDRLLAYMGTKYSDPVNLGEDIVLSASGSCERTLDAGAGYQSYRWSTGETSQSIVVSEPGTYSVLASDAYGFLAADTIEISFGAASLEDEYVLCDYDSLLWDLELGAGFTFQWSDGLTTETPSRYLAPGSAYYVDIIGEFCSERSDTVVINSDDFSQTDFLDEGGDYCIGNVIGLANGADEAVGLLWSTGSVAPAIQPAASGDYWVEATNALGCIGSDTISVNIIGTAPEVIFNDNSGCVGSEILFEDLTEPVDGEIESWLWDFGTSSSEDEQAFGVFDSPGTHPVTLTVFVDNGCFGEGTGEVTVFPLPSVLFSDPVVCAGNPAFFEDLSTVLGGAAISERLWTFSNGETDEGPIGQTVFETLGVETVGLEVSSSQGCTNSEVRTVEVLGSPAADFTPQDVCAGTPVVFQEDVDTSESGPVFYNWQFGDGFFSNFPNTSHTYAQQGTYQVTLTATGNNQGQTGCVSSVTRTVRVFPPPAAAASAEDACLGTPAALTDLTVPAVLSGEPDPVVSRTWTVNGTPAGTAAETTFTPTSADLTYDVQLSLTTQAGCTAQASAAFAAAEIPEADFSLTLPEASPPITAVPVNTSSDAEGYVWLLDGTAVSTDFEPELIFPKTGTYTVTLAAVNDLGCNDTLSLSKTVIDPAYDLALLGIETAEEDGRLEIGAVVRNGSNVPVRHFDYGLRIGQDVNLTARADFLIQPGETVLWPVEADFFLTPGRTLPYVCITLSNPNGILDLSPPLAETDTTDNSRCTALDRPGPTFAPPYPNPSSDAFKLGIIMPESAELRITMIDAAGREVRSAAWTLPSGFSVIDRPLDGIMSGVYLLKYETAGTVHTERVVVGR